jgi:hypothetical protein
VGQKKSIYNVIELLSEPNVHKRIVEPNIQNPWNILGQDYHRKPRVCLLKHVLIKGFKRYQTEYFTQASIDNVTLVKCPFVL